MTAREYLGQAYRLDQRINNKLQHNRAYVPGESFLFVADYLKQHCPQARK